MSEHVNINVDWAEADESGLVGGQGVVDVTAVQHTGREPRHGEAVVTIGSQSKTVALEQEGKGEFVSFDRLAYEISGNGGTVEITGRSNTRELGFSVAPQYFAPILPQYFSITTSDGVVHGNMYVSGQWFSSDPGAVAEYTFRLFVTIGANATDEDRIIRLDANYGDGFVSSCELHQEPQGAHPQPAGYLQFYPETAYLGWDTESFTFQVESGASWVLKLY